MVDADTHTFLHGHLADHDEAEALQKFVLFYEVRTEITTGEERLMFAMMKDAIDLIVRPHKRSKKTWQAMSNWIRRSKQDAIDWVKEKDSSFVFSFGFICEHFGFDASATRKILLEHPERIWANMVRQRATGGGNRSVRIDERNQAA